VGTDFIFLFNTFCEPERVCGWWKNTFLMEKGLSFVQLAGALAFFLFSETEGLNSPLVMARAFLVYWRRRGCAPLE
jgi:hypothetical protein